MTDTATAEPKVAHDWSSDAARRRVRRRYAADVRLKVYGMGAAGLAMMLLGVLLAALIHSGYVAFVATKVNVEVFLDPAQINAANPEAADYRKIARDAFFAYFPNVKSNAEKRRLGGMLSSGAQYIVRDYVIANRDKIGQRIVIPIPLSDPFDQLHKGIIPRYIDALPHDRIALLKELKKRGIVGVENGQGVIRAKVDIDPAMLTAGQLDAGEQQAVAERVLADYFLETVGPAFNELLSDSWAQVFKEALATNTSRAGEAIEVHLPVSEHYDKFLRKGEAKIVNPRFTSQEELAWFDLLKQKGLIGTPFSWELFVNPDSRFPELAGLAGALSGSFLTLLVCFLLSFPIGIAAATYLEEFAPKNRWTDLVEVNINNLAAVPSVIFGLLGLAVFIGIFGLPRSAPLVGSMVLALMTLPTVIVATRAALKAVPPSIREAALGVGASRHQTMLHHVLPLAMPGILTGIIIGLAQALGETAPLLLIGMNAFIPSIDNVGLLQPATALPTQIFSWADSPERGFVSRTSAAILVLMGFLVLMNSAAVLLRRRLERKW